MYKDPETRKAFKAKWLKEFRAKNPDYHRDQMRRLRASDPRLFRERIDPNESELDRLIREQAKDDRTTHIKYDLPYWEDGDNVGLT